MKKTGLIAMILSAVLGAFCLLCGCSTADNGDVITITDGDTKDKSEIVTYYGFKADAINLIAIEKAVDDFNAAHSKINIVYEGVKGKPYWSAFDRRLAANALDDIFMVNHDRILDMSANGLLADISSALDVNKFGYLARDQLLNVDGSVYFVPTSISTYGMFVNYDVLKAHNLQVPQTYAEFETVCDYFVSNGITPIIMNNGSSLRSLMVAKSLFPVYAGNGTKAALEEFNAAPEKLAPYFDNGVDLAATMLEKKWFDAREAIETADTGDDVNIFVQGKRPFMITGSLSSVLVADSNAKLNYGVHPFPIIDGGNVVVTEADTCVAVNASSEHVEQALEFVSFITQRNTVWEYCNSQSSYTVLDDMRTPSDKAIAPLTAYLRNTPSVVGSDYKL
ncbi:MAG: extracellular solute-binding protein, partial [Clostridiales bacterium]|nr:extracellular solute-binding protein [Clostridiales bacterium]